MNSKMRFLSWCWTYCCSIGLSNSDIAHDDGAEVIDVLSKIGQVRTFSVMFWDWKCYIMVQQTCVLLHLAILGLPGIFFFVVNLYPPLSSARQRPSCGDCLEVKREYYQNCSVLRCVTQCSQSAAHSCEQFLQVQQIGFVTLGSLCHA